MVRLLCVCVCVHVCVCVCVPNLSVALAQALILALTLPWSYLNHDCYCLVPWVESQATEYLFSALLGIMLACTQAPRCECLDLVWTGIQHLGSQHSPSSIHLCIVLSATRIGRYDSALIPSTCGLATQPTFL